MVEISPSCCNEFDAFSPVHKAAMLERGAHVVKLYTRPSDGEESNAKNEARLDEARPPPSLELSPQIASFLSRSSMQHTRDAFEGVPLGFKGSFESLQDASETSLSVNRDESDSSHERLYTPAEYRSCSSNSIAAPADLKLQEYAQELARIKAQRPWRNSALQEKMLSEIDIPGNAGELEQAPHQMVCPLSSITEVQKLEEAASLSAGSSEENLAFLDASSDAPNGDSDMESVKDDFRATNDKVQAESMDLTFMHSVYRSRGTHEEAILVRMKYAGGTGRKEPAEDPKPTSATSALSMLASAKRSGCQAAPATFNPELVKECADLLRETLRKCTTAPPQKNCSEIYEWSPTPKIGSDQASGSASPPQMVAPQESESKSQSRSLSKQSTPSTTRPVSPTPSPSLPLLPLRAPSRVPSRAPFRMAASSASLPPIPGTPTPSLTVIPASPSSSKASSSDPVISQSAIILTRPTSSRSLPPPPNQSVVTLPSSRQSSQSSSPRSSSPMLPVPEHRPVSYPVSSSESPPLSSHPATVTPYESDKSDTEEYATDEAGALWVLQDPVQRKTLATDMPIPIPITIDGRVVYPEVVFAEEKGYHDFVESTKGELNPFSGLCEKLKPFAEGCGLHFIQGKEPPANPTDVLFGPEGARASDELNTALLARLSCVECGSFCAPPVAFCVWGHVVCEQCRPVCLWEDVTCWCRARCPQCCSEMQRRPCALWSYIARSLLYPCRFWVYGCNKTAGLSCEEKMLHETTCSCRQLRCWAEGCEWQGVWHHLRGHVLKVHLSGAVQAEWYRFVNLCSPPCERSADVIVLPSKELVLLHSLPVVSEQRYILQYLNAESRADAVVFLPRFRLRIISADGKSELEMRGEAVPGQHDIETALRSGRCFRLSSTPFGVSATEPLKELHFGAGCVQLCLEKGRTTVC